MKSKMSPMGDPSNPIYHLQPGRTQNLEQNLTPHSAVSSFNLPAAYDSSLITPVSMTSSPNIATRSAPALRRDLDSNLSPLISPTSYQLGWDPESYGPTYGQPMKHKDRSVALQLSTVDQVFPPSPSYMVAPNHYFGHYTVSAPVSARTSNSSPSLHQSPHLQNSPNMQSAGGISNSSSYHSMHNSSQNGSMFRQSNQAPILIAPNPNNLRAATVKQEYGPSHMDSMSSSRSPPSSYAPIQRTFPEPPASLPSRGKKSHKRKEPPSPYYDEIASSSDLNDGERLLLQLTTRDHLQWKEVAQKWNKAMNLDKSVAALQMRKKRLQERLRVWTDDENRALEMSMEDYDKAKWDIKWEFITDGMRKHGSRETWSKLDVQRHYNEVHHQEYDMPPRKRASRSSSESEGHSPFSEDQESATYSLENEDSGGLGSILSPASTHERRSRATSDASIQLKRQQQQQHQQHQQHQRQEHQRLTQAQLMFEHQQQGWGPSS